MKIRLIGLTVFAFSMPLFAGGIPGSFAVEAGVLKPSGTWAGGYSNNSSTNPPKGYTFGLSMHFNSESRYQGRVRIGFLETGKAPESQVSYSTPQPLPANQIMVGRNYWRGLTVGYDWMPHLFEGGRSGPFAILGAHGVAWTRRSSNTHPAPLDPSAPPNTANSGADVLPAILATIGLGYKFSPRSSVEIRMIQSSSTAAAGSGGKGFILVAAFRL